MSASRRGLQLCALLVGPCLGSSTILVYNSNNNDHNTTTVPTTFADQPAGTGFGPKVPDEGFAGRLQRPGPSNFACSPIDGPLESLSLMPKSGPAASERVILDRSKGMSAEGGEQDEDEEAGGEEGRGDGGGKAAATTRAVASAAWPTAALISRSVEGDPVACTFETKVLHAQDAGFAMVIVYDYEQGGLFTMTRPKPEEDSEFRDRAINIPSVLVTHASGLALTAMIAASDDPRGPKVYVDSASGKEGMTLTLNLTTFLLVTGFFLALLFCGAMMVFTLHRYLRRYESLVAGTNRPMSLPEVLQLPEVIVEAGSRLEGESCPVCLEPYRIGDKRPSFDSPTVQRSDSPAPTPVSPIVDENPVIGRALSPSVVEGAGGGARGWWWVGGGGTDRLPLLANPRGRSIRGGAIQGTSPV
eukprot:jgi/Undpi1/12141/HiC_scaffold_5.g01817.m1